MSCSRKKRTREPKQGRYQCQACGQVRKKDSKLCKPRAITDPERARELQRDEAHELRRRR